MLSGFELSLGAPVSVRSPEREDVVYVTFPNERSKKALS